MTCGMSSEPWFITLGISSILVEYSSLKILSITVKISSLFVVILPSCLAVYISLSSLCRISAFQAFISFHCVSDLFCFSFFVLFILWLYYISIHLFNVHFNSVILILWWFRYLLMSFEMFLYSWERSTSYWLFFSSPSCFFLHLKFGSYILRWFPVMILERRPLPKIWQHWVPVIRIF